MVGWPTFYYFTTPTKVSVLRSNIHSTSTRRGTKFTHPSLTRQELQSGSRLGLDTWADTSCSGKHAFVAEFIEGKVVTASGFSPSLGTVKDLPMANVLYAYDKSDGTTILLEHNNTLYLGPDIEDSLANPIQSEEIGIRVDLRPKVFYPNDPTSQSITFADGTVIPIQYDGVLPLIPVRRPSPIEVDSCERLPFSSPYDWDPFKERCTFSQLVSNYSAFDSSYFIDILEMSDPISSELSLRGLDATLNSQDEVNAIQALKSKTSTSLTPESLSKLWGIGLKTAKRTIEATTHQCIRSTGLLSKRFKTDKSQLRYKQLSRRYGGFYVDYLKVGVKSIRQFIGGTLYTNKLGFKNFFPCSNETSGETGHTLKSFIELVGLPPSLHSDNHSNFKEGLFKQLLRKFGIGATYTEPHSPWQNRAEYAIGEVKAHARKLMQSTNTPVRLWCFCYEYCADILSLCATGRFDLQGRKPYETVMNYTPDISEYASYGWFQWCWYFDEKTVVRTSSQYRASVLLLHSFGIRRIYCEIINFGDSR